eukprot:PhM_4_TR8622/c0_g2_i1/m.53381
MYQRQNTIPTRVGGDGRGGGVGGGSPQYTMNPYYYKAQQQKRQQQQQALKSNSLAHRAWLRGERTLRTHMDDLLTHIIAIAVCGAVLVSLLSLDKRVTVKMAAVAALVAAVCIGLSVDRMFRRRFVLRVMAVPVQVTLGASVAVAAAFTFQLLNLVHVRHDDPMWIFGCVCVTLGVPMLLGVMLLRFQL